MALDRSEGRAAIPVTGPLRQDWINRADRTLAAALTARSAGHVLLESAPTMSSPGAVTTPVPSNGAPSRERPGTMSDPHRCPFADHEGTGDPDRTLPAGQPPACEREGGPAGLM